MMRCDQRVGKRVSEEDGKFKNNTIHRLKWMKGWKLKAKIVITQYDSEFL